MDTESTTRIWPGPECLISKRMMAEEAFASGMVAKGWRLSAEAANEKLREMELARGIGEGRAKARRRMERFIGWCDGHNICVAGLRHCKRSWSPEHAVFTAATAASINVNTGPIIVAEWAGHWDHKSEMSFQRYWVRNCGWLRSIRNYLASPEWHYLPWQRDPEVACG